MQILIVDDDPAIRGMVSFLLETKGYVITEACSRKEAIESLKEATPQVVILDMGMPPNEHTADEGLAVLDWLSSYQPQVKTLVLTGQDMQTTSYLALKQGAFDFLEKPISQDALLFSVQRAFLFYDQAQKLKEQEGVQKVEIDAFVGEGVKSIRNQAEEKLLKQVLAETQFNVHETARRLGIKRENVYYLIKKYGLQRDNLSV
ncbi:response regulator [Thiomicrorhabdus sp.]|uniref:response regulator n=1 Tax=Thiomicrorhabdus sp. TaxID=2039724 RepID=UPI0035636858